MESQPDLKNIAKSVSDKIRSENGTTCHQCRQKTLDTKTKCCTKACITGQFCGPCLKNRYTESVADALNNPEWECPPCRNICNCSICRSENSGKKENLAPAIRQIRNSQINDYFKPIGKKDLLEKDIGNSLDRTNGSIQEEASDLSDEETGDVLDKIISGDKHEAILDNSKLLGFKKKRTLRKRS